MNDFELKTMTRNESPPENVGAENVTPYSKKIDFYESFWIFLTGSVVGFTAEFLWCVLRTGRLENRASMIFGPFSAIYGIAALVLYFISSYAPKNNFPAVFALGAAGLTLMEYLCSLFQETLFGSVSWDYSKRSFNIGGRVCLMYSFIWGLLALLWFAVIQPRIVPLIAKIPPRVYKPLTWTLVIFLVADIALSAVAVSRWGMRLNGIHPAGIVAQMIDRLFPNEFMVKIYPNMYW